MNYLESQLQNLTLIIPPHRHFHNRMEVENKSNTIETSVSSFGDFEIPRPPSQFDHEKKNFLQMWCDDSTYFRGKFSTGATPLLAQKKMQAKLKNREYSLKKMKMLSEKASRKKSIIKKSVFFKKRTNLVQEFEDLKYVDFIQQDDEFHGEELKTPSPKAKKINVLQCQSYSLKKGKNNGFSQDLDTTEDTADYIEEDDTFLRGQNSYTSPLTRSQRKSSRKCESPKHSRFKSDYELLEVIGNGYFGTVYKCLNKIDGLIYAIKCTKNKIHSKNSKNISLNEAKALAAFSNHDDNPYIVRYYNAWIESDQLYLAMEHCNYSLRHLISSIQYFNDSQIREILRDVVSGLKVLHSQNVVHLDIKPENILYSQSKKYKIADLGLSRVAIRVKGEDIIEGDSRYLAPELLNDIHDNYMPDLTKADIFSLGVTFYELISGKVIPNNGEEWHNIRSMKLDWLDRDKTHSESLKNLIRSMLNPQAHLRPSAEELLSSGYLESESQMEMKWGKIENQMLKKKVGEYEKVLKIQRKKSI